MRSPLTPSPGSSGPPGPAHPPCPGWLVPTWFLALHRTLWLGLVLLIALAPGLAMAKTAFRVESVVTRTVGDELVMDAHFTPVLTPVALEALDNGVPLTFEVWYQIREANAWIWAASLVDRRLRYEIRYQPLSERYRVGPVQGGGKNYVTRDAAIAALAELHDLPLLSRSELKPDQDYEIDLKVSLDIEELPLPLRPMAYLFPSWKLSTGWTSWPLRP